MTWVTITLSPSSAVWVSTTLPGNGWVAIDKPEPNNVSRVDADEGLVEWSFRGEAGKQILRIVLLVNLSLT